MRARIAMIAPALLAPILLAACSMSAPDSVVYGTVTVTRHADTATWATYTTYSVDPTVVVLDDTGNVAQQCTVDGTQLVPTIVQNMDARNYHQVNFGVVADLEIKMTALLGSQNIYYANYCGWYPYYWCYPGYTYAGSYSFGTLILTMGDVKDASGTKLPLVWTAANYGVLSSYYSVNCASGTTGVAVDWNRLRAGIDQAFQDSPYIQRAP